MNTATQHIIVTKYLWQSQQELISTKKLSKLPLGLESSRVYLISFGRCICLIGVRKRIKKNFYVSVSMTSDPKRSGLKRHHD